MIIINASIVYDNSKHDEMSSYLITFSCQFGRYIYMRLPFRVASAGDMFQRKKKLSESYQMYLVLQIIF